MRGDGDDRPTFYEFFAGGGMVRSGLGSGWRLLLANDVDPKKAAAYTANFGADGLVVGDIAALTGADLPGRADLAWASFPCQDVSLAGPGGGLSGARSGLFWSFHRLLAALRAEGRAPTIVAIENVCGLYTARGGADLAALLDALVALGYRPGPMVIDGARFTAQSRPRLFIVATLPFGAGATATQGAIDALAADAPDPETAPPGLVDAVRRSAAGTRRAVIWWRSPPAPQRPPRLADIVEPTASNWLDAQETARLIGLASQRQADKLAQAQARARAAGRPVYGALFRRGRPGPDGRTRQRVEWRFDGLAGCLRTPAGGSSRQSLMEVTPTGARIRLFTPREAARLMGLADAYQLPATRTDAYKLVGDGVVAPAVAALGRGLFEPLLTGRAPRSAALFEQGRHHISDDEPAHQAVKEPQPQIGG